MNKLQKPIRIIALIVLLVGGLGISIFAGTKVSGLFLNSAKADQCSAQNVKSTQVTSNSAVVGWDTSDSARGGLRYGTNSKSLTLSALEQSDAKTHNLPLTVLTPNTKYFYIIQIGNKVCDASGASYDIGKNEDKYVPWTFTTEPVNATGEIVAPMESTTPITLASASPSAAVKPSSKPNGSSGSIAPSIKPSFAVTSGPTPTSGLSTFCKELSKNIGKTSISTDWAIVKKYDLDNNGIINGKDVIKCPGTGN
jgi:hypothetical protein